MEKKNSWKSYPLPLPEAIEEVISHLNEQEKQQIATSRKDSLIFLHNRYGQSIRNNLGIWSYYKNREDSIRHPDMESYLIIEGVWEKIRQDKSDCE